MSDHTRQRSASTDPTTMWPRRSATCSTSGRRSLRHHHRMAADTEPMRPLAARSTPHDGVSPGREDRRPPRGKHESTRGRSPRSLRPPCPRLRSPRRTTPEPSADPLPPTAHRRARSDRSIARQGDRGRPGLGVRPPLRRTAPPGEPRGEDQSGRQRTHESRRGATRATTDLPAAALWNPRVPNTSRPACSNR